MSYILTNDLHPGRCENTRQYRHNDGYIETLRCLDYELIPHQCSFPEPTHVVIRNNVFNSYQNPEPKPWVKPGDEDGGKEET